MTASQKNTFLQEEDRRPLMVDIHSVPRMLTTHVCFSCYSSPSVFLMLSSLHLCGSRPSFIKVVGV